MSDAGLTDGLPPDDEPPALPEPVAASRARFLMMAVVVQGGLIGLALLLAWWWRIDLWGMFRVTPRATAWGLAATVPLLILPWASYRWDWGPLRKTRDLVEEALNPFLRVCRWYDLLLIALLAGVSEELLFRGVLLPYFERWQAGLGVVVSCVVFGLAHSVTRLYILVTAAIGAYFVGCLYLDGGDMNLYIPTLTHAAYDLIVFGIMARRARLPAAAAPPKTA